MKTRHYILAFLLPLAALPSTAVAAQLSPSQALGRVNPQNPAARQLRAKANPTPVLTVKAENNADFTGLYVFDDGQSGFMVVSADDCATPLLGYSDSESLNPSSIPPQLQYWLQFYANEIQYAATHPQKSTRREASSSTRPYRAPIAPMTVSKWNQSAPYNDDCPMDNGKRSVTGCVATAMAQAMYYHKWPEKGTGSHSYKWNGTELSVDFGSTTYDWDAMTPTYDSSSTDAAKAAVANLMYSCGVSVNMNYTSDESGASGLDLGPALYKYFGYDKSMAQPQRYFYGLIDWENMVYDQLSQGMPVLYGGQSYEGGHQFVCDGYSSDGYFHFNWGWGGMSDGYFLLDALDPMSQGIGGSADASGFNYDQGILINMRPAQAGSKATPLIYCYGNFETTASSAVNLGDQVEFKSSDGFFNFGVAEISGFMGIKVTDSQGNVRYVKHDGKLDFGATSGYESYKVTLPSDLADGTYTVAPAFLQDGESEWMDVLCPLSGVQALTMNVSNGEAAFSNASLAQIEVTNLAFNTPLYLDTDFQAEITFTNTGSEEYFGEFSFYLFDQNGNEAGMSADLDAVDLQPGESTTITYVSEFPSSYQTDNGTVTLLPGQYYLAIYSHFTNQQIYVDQTPVTISDAPSETEIGIESITVASVDWKSDSEAQVNFQGEASCLQGYFAGQLEVAVFRKGTGSTTMTGKTDYLFIDNGNEDSFTAHVSVTDAKPGEEFFAVVFHDGKQLTDGYDFTLESNGVSTIEGERSVGDVEYYNLQGQRILNPDHGIYIRIQNGVSTKVVI